MGEYGAVLFEYCRSIVDSLPKGKKYRYKVVFIENRLKDEEEYQCDK